VQKNGKTELLTSGQQAVSIAADVGLHLSARTFLSITRAGNSLAKELRN
jgi:hypothetical protein